MSPDKEQEILSGTGAATATNSNSTLAAKPAATPVKTPVVAAPQKVEVKLISQDEIDTKMLKQNNEWEGKIAAQLSSFDGKIEHLKAKFQKDMVAAEIKQKSLLNTENEKYNKTLETTEEQMNTINKMHDTEVQNVFEDNKTLGFIQKMRGFKQAW